MHFLLIFVYDDRGYFPEHYGPVAHHYRQPFSSANLNAGYQGHFRLNPDPESPLEGIMSSASSTWSTPASETTAHTTAASSSTCIPSVPELPLMIPMGKYHPANYKSGLSTPATTSPSAHAVPLPPTNLALPHPSNKRQRPPHQRKNSEVKRKLQQYQQNMIAQARSAAASASPSSATSSSLKFYIKEPNSPKLGPAGSPGPITPFELEESATAGYVLGGTRVASSGLTAGSLEREREKVMKNLLEEERRRGRTGAGSPRVAGL